MKKTIETYIVYRKVARQLKDSDRLDWLFDCDVISQTTNIDYLKSDLKSGKGRKLAKVKIEIENIKIEEMKNEF